MTSASGAASLIVPEATAWTCPTRQEHLGWLVDIAAGQGRLHLW